MPVRINHYFIIENTFPFTPAVLGEALAIRGVWWWSAGVRVQLGGAVLEPWTRVGGRPGRASGSATRLQTLYGPPVWSFTSN